MPNNLVVGGGSRRGLEGGMGSAFGMFALGKTMRAFAAFAAFHALRSHHLPVLFFLLVATAGAAMSVVALQKPWNGKPVSSNKIMKLVFGGMILASTLTLWTIGLRECGPLRTLLMDGAEMPLYYLFSILVKKEKPDKRKTRGTVLIILAYALILFDATNRAPSGRGLLRRTKMGRDVDERIVRFKNGTLAKLYNFKKAGVAKVKLNKNYDERRFDAKRMRSPQRRLLADITGSGANAEDVVRAHREEMIRMHGMHARMAADVRRSAGSGVVKQEELSAADVKSAGDAKPADDAKSADVAGGETAGDSKPRTARSDQGDVNSAKLNEEVAGDDDTAGNTKDTGADRGASDGSPGQKPATDGDSGGNGDSDDDEDDANWEDDVDDKEFEDVTDEYDNYLENYNDEYNDYADEEQLEEKLDDSKFKDKDQVLRSILPNEFVQLRRPHRVLGVVLIIMSSVITQASRGYTRHVAGEIGGAKRFFSLSLATAAGTLLVPGLLSYFLASSPVHLSSLSLLQFLAVGFLWLAVPYYTRSLVSTKLNAKILLQAGVIFPFIVACAAASIFGFGQLAGGVSVVLVIAFVLSSVGFKLVMADMKVGQELPTDSKSVENKD